MTKRKIKAKHQGLNELGVRYLLERWTILAAQWESDSKYHQKAIFKDDPLAKVRAERCRARASIYQVCLQDLMMEMKIDRKEGISYE